jgi:stalled ribosome rescue protein Dom34
MASQKKFGVWMDKQVATVIVKDDTIEKGDGDIMVLAHIVGEKISPTSSEKTANNHEKMAQAKFFKQIASQLQNATYVHITGTGQVQEQFMHYLAATPQFKNTQTDESTSNKMSDEKLIDMMAEKLK